MDRSREYGSAIVSDCTPHAIRLSTQVYAHRANSASHTNLQGTRLCWSTCTQKISFKKKRRAAFLLVPSCSRRMSSRKKNVLQKIVPDAHT